MRRAGLPALTLAFASAALAEGLHDPNIRLAQVRSDYAALDEGTAANPLTIVHPCLWPDGTPGLLVPCFTGPDVFPHSNAYRFPGLAAASPQHWLLLLNNEPWNAPGNSGPPDQSLPRAIPGAGVMGFGASPALSLADGLYWRFHLALSHLHDNPVGPYAIPFLSIGASAARGNGGPVGTLNDPDGRHVVRFHTRLDAIFDAPPDRLWTLSHFLWATAEWGGKPRMVFVHLYHGGYTHGGVPFEYSTPTSPGGTSLWNWPIAESALFPGAEVAFIDAEDTFVHCGFETPALTAPGQTLDAEIDLQALYRCLSDLGFYDEPMPERDPIPITGVHWANELTGERVAIATTVWGIDLAGATDTAEKRDGAGAADFGRVRPGAETAAIVAGLERACAADPACRSHRAMTTDASPTTRDGIGPAASLGWPDRPALRSRPVVPLRNRR